MSQLPPNEIGTPLLPTPWASQSTEAFAAQPVVAPGTSAQARGTQPSPEGFAGWQAVPLTQPPPTVSQPAGQGSAINIPGGWPDHHHHHHHYHYHHNQAIPHLPPGVQPPAAHAPWTLVSGPQHTYAAPPPVHPFPPSMAGSLPPAPMMVFAPPYAAHHHNLQYVAPPPSAAAAQPVQPMAMLPPTPGKGLPSFSATLASHPAQAPPSIGTQPSREDGSWSKSSPKSASGGSGEPGSGGLDHMLAMKQRADGRTVSEAVTRPMRGGTTRREIQLRGQAHIIVFPVLRPKTLPPYCVEAGGGSGSQPPSFDFFVGDAATLPESTQLVVEVTQMRHAPSVQSPHPDRRFLGCLVVFEEPSKVLSIHVREAAQPPSHPRTGPDGATAAPTPQYLDRKPDRIWLILRALLSHTPRALWADYTALRLSPSLCVHRELSAACKTLGLAVPFPPSGRGEHDVPMRTVLALRDSFTGQSAGGDVL